jgi:uncharacterized protein
LPFGHPAVTWRFTTSLRSTWQWRNRHPPPFGPVVIVLEGKFYSIFISLWSGMAIQFSRARERGARFGPFGVRRMLVLLGFGLIHAFLFWPGDILILYSVMGIALLLWRNGRPRTLLIWVVAFLLLPLLLNAALSGLTKLGTASMGEEAMARADE